jgi:hypothetical protein
MALQNAVQNDGHTAQRITWSAGSAVKDLTGATITGTITDVQTQTTRAITGTLALVTAASGIFSWQYSAADTATVGAYTVQFTATYGDGLIDSSFSASWEVMVKR